MQHGFKFKVKDVSLDPQAQREMQAHQMQGVPSFLIGEEVIVGFDKNRLLALKDFKIFTCSKCGTKSRVPKNKGSILLTCQGCQTKYKIKT